MPAISCSRSAPSSASRKPNTAPFPNGSTMDRPMDSPARYRKHCSVTVLAPLPLPPPFPSYPHPQHYFATAAAAEEYGLRSCLRWRAESSPGTPAWMGTSATVSRALRLMNESVLEVGDMDAFAERLGIGSRHLRRLFLKHLGASPIAVAQTRRLHFAKKLIDESHLSMRDVAIASGFGSIRRFNATFLKTYGRTPTQLRNASRPAAAGPDSEYRFLLRFRPPFCWAALLEFLAPRAIPGVEIVEGETYRRVFLLENQ